MIVNISGWDEDEEEKVYLKEGVVHTSSAKQREAFTAKDHFP